MRTIQITALLFILLIAACGGNEPVASGPAVDTREPIGIFYVASSELQVREKADSGAPVIATFNGGEQVSVLARQGEWAEVRTGGSTGWAPMSELTDAAGMEQARSNPTPKFVVVPSPVSAPGARGEIYLEADVNSDGEVVNVKTIMNSTGSEALVAQNSAALRAAKFEPISQDGVRKPFKYYHRVTY